MSIEKPWTVGVVGHGVSAPSRTRKRPDLCAEAHHPGVTYNPWQDRTWCLCGDIIRDGDHATHADCCGGVLEERYCEIAARRLTQDVLDFGEAP